MFVLNEWANKYFEETLHNHVDGVAIGMAYFRQRGLRDDIIRKFHLGYSLPVRDALAKAALAKGFSEEMLEKPDSVTAPTRGACSTATTPASSSLCKPFRA